MTTPSATDPVDSDDDQEEADDDVPSQANTDRDIAAAGLGLVEDLNKKAGDAARAAGVADDVLDANRAVGAAARAAGRVATAADPAIAALDEWRRAKSEGADLGE